MTKSQDYQKAYNRQKAAREKAEALLESRSRELFKSNEDLRSAIDKLKKQKAHLVQQEKLASIGMLAAGIAHEINNPVGFVKSNLQTLISYLKSIQETLQLQEKIIEELPESAAKDISESLTDLKKFKDEEEIEFLVDDSLESINEALTGIDRVEEIVRNLKDYSRSESEQRTLTDINECIDNTLKLIWNELKYKCDITKSYDNLPMIYTCPGQLNQIFVNLAVNAAQAIEDKGSLEIRTSCDSENIYIDFIDDGPGISEENLVRLFDPFFTTKDVGVGTGLGLYISHGLAKKHRGSITCENLEDKGAKFTVTLPIDIRKNGSR